MALPLDTVVKQLEDSGVISDGKLENFVPPKAHPTSADELIAELVKQNHLTKFQAAQVAAGKAKSLILGGYTILDKIGAGGMGQVFKAKHRRMDRLVAIKMLPPGTMKDAAAVARFEREVKAAAKLRHPNIVAADDADMFNGVHFLVMEFVDGRDLSATVKRDGPLPVAKATNVVLQAARGLEFAHGEGVVHRDIKPGNLLIDKKGTVKILDMGLARIDTGGDVATQAELTGSGTVMGTVDYMAPEQAISTKGVDGRADIYSLGCTLFYLLTGRATYLGETVTAKLIAHQAHPIPNLPEFCAEASPELTAVFCKMLAKTAAERYQSMTEVIADLERIQADGRQGTGDGGIGRSGGSTGMGSGPSLGPKTAEVIADPESAASLLKGVQITPTAPTARSTKASPHLAAGLAPARSDDAATQDARGQAPRLNKKLVLSLVYGLVACAVLAAAFILAPKTQESEPAEVVKALPPLNIAKPITAATGFALDFDGKTSFVATPIKYDGAHPITLEAYVSPRELLRTETSIIANGNKETGLALCGFERGWEVRIQKDRPKSALDRQPELNRRVHLAGVWTGETLTLFVDGIAQPSTPATEILPSLEKLVIGANYSDQLMTDVGSVFSGTIDEVRISKVARYTTDFTPQPRFEPDAATLALYHFDEGSGTIARDASPNKNDATIVGAKWVAAAAPGGLPSAVLTPPSPSFLTPTPSQANVPAEALTFNGHRYLLIDELSTWAHAKARAELMGGHLATINSLAECNWVLENVWRKRPKTGPDDRIYLGGSLAAGQTQWTWVTGEPFDEALWLGAKSSPPIVDGKVRDHGLLWHLDTSWRAIPVNGGQETYFLVEWETPEASNPAAPPPGDYALLFDGDDEVEFFEPLNYRVDGCTVEAYVRTDAHTRLATVYALSDRGSLGLDSFEGKHWRLQHSIGFGGSFAQSSQPIVLGQRVHVAGVYSNSDFRLFVDGKLVKREPRPDQKFTVGQEPPRIGKLFRGVIDEIRVSNGALYSEDFKPKLQLQSAKGTIAFYPCNEGSGEVLNNASGNLLHGRIKGAKWVRADGSAIPMPAATPAAGGFALDFDGQTSYVTSQIIYDGTHPLTFEAVVRARNVVKPGIVIGNTSSSDFGFNVIGDQTHWMFRFSEPSIGAHLASSSTIRPSDTHLACVFDGNEIRLFVDGKLQGKRTAVYRPSAANVYIGALYGPKILFDGTIDEVRLSKVARYTSDFTPQPRFEPDADTLALYHFDEGSGTIARDASPNKNDATIVGAKWVAAATSGGVSSAAPTRTAPPPSFLAPMTPTPNVAAPAEALIFNGHRYLLVEETLNWDAAKAKAAALGGHLAVITTQEENDWIKSTALASLVDGKLAWIGGEKPAASKSHTWVSGEPWEFTDWSPGTTKQPESTNAGVAIIRGSSTQLGWGDWPATTPAWALSGSLQGKNRAQGYLVEWETLAAPSTAASPVAAGFALDFDGVDDTVDVPGLGQSFSSPLTLEAWVQPRELINQSDVAMFGDDKASRLRLKVNKFEWDALVGGSDAAKYNFVGGGAQAGRRDHLAAVWTGDKLTTFVNGVPYSIDVRPELKAELAKMPLIDRLRIGSGTDAAGQVDRVFSGTIDELRVSQTARYADAFTPQQRFEPDADTLALYHFDEGTGDQLVDSSGHGRHGKITGAKWVPAALASGEHLGNSPGAKTSASPPLTPYELFTSPDYEWSAPENLGPPVNAIGGESSPFVSADGLTLWFESQREGGVGNYDLWMSRRPTPEAPWSAPENLGPKINSLVFERAPTVSADELTLVFVSDRFRKPGSFQLWTATRPTKDDPWSEPVTVPTGLSLAYFDSDPELSADGLTLYFHSTRPGGQAGEDLWQCRRRTATDRWDKAENLGPVVNGGGRDFAAAISSDDRVLVFASDRSGGGGRSDLWWSSRASPSEPWSTPTNLGPVVNSSIDDLCPALSADGQTLYFRSNRPGSLGTTNEPDIWISRRVLKAGAAAPPANSGASKTLADPAFQAWLKTTQALPAAEQITAVAAKLKELNPGFDGKLSGYDRNGTPKIENGVVTELGFYSVGVTDVAPVRALVGLKFLFCGGGTNAASKLSDLSSLQGLPLTTFNCGGTSVEDLSALRGMRLTALFCGITNVSDLTPLAGMPLGILNLYGTQVSDVSRLESCKSLKSLQIEKTQVTADQVAALQASLPKCKIEWDDPAKAAAPAATASGTK